MFTDLEFEEYWIDWVAMEATNYKTGNGKPARTYLKKGYTHFDHRFWFPERKDELKRILKKKLRVFHKGHHRDEWWAFSPFLKILLKTPRYRYQEEEGYYDLETKIRPICFASHMDSLIFGFYAFVLTRRYEKYIEENGFNDCPIAYRSNLGGKCNIQFAKEAFDEVKRRGECAAIALDIKGYFDNIDHETLKEKWCKVLGERLPEDQFKLYKTLTRYSYVVKNSLLRKYGVKLNRLPMQPSSLLDVIPGGKDYEKFERLRKDRLIVVNDRPNKNGRMTGIPQGSGMSSVLSNIYLIDFDKELSEKSRNEDFYYRRYCDDILIVCNRDKAEELQRFTIEKIREEYHLEVQDKKVELTEFRENSKKRIRAFNKKKMLALGLEATDGTNEKYFYKSVQYLGFEYNGQSNFIRSSSLSRYFKKLKGRIIKTVMMSYSKNGRTDKIWKRQIFERYTHLGKRNFLTYAYNAASNTYTNIKGESKSGMNSRSIRKQLARHMQILMETLEIKNRQRFNYKYRLGKVSKMKKT